MKFTNRPVMKNISYILCLMLTAVVSPAGEQPQVRVAPVDSVGPRTVEAQTKTSVVRDYLEAWKSMSRALEQNNEALLNADFLGVAREQLAGTVRDQRKLGLQTRYRDHKHDISLVFYSPEGLSIQLVDTVEYDVQILDHDKLQASQHVRTRYLAVLTPTEVRWKVRFFQAILQ
jgi:hypothetical protein